MYRPVLLALLVLVACGRSNSRPGIPPRHVVLITVEGLRADHCSAYLYPRDTTTFPISAENREAGRNLTLDELAHEGVLFTQAFAPTGHPADSLAAIHTGRRADPGVAPGGAVDMAHARTLAEGFLDAGLETVAFVSAVQELPAELSKGFTTHEVFADDWGVARRSIEYTAARDWGDGRGLFLWLHLSQPTPPFWPVPSGGVKLDKDYTSLYQAASYGGERDGRVLHSRTQAGEELGGAELEHLSNLYDGELALTGFVLYSFLDFYRYGSATSGVWDSTLTVVAGTGGVELGERYGQDPWEVLHDSGLRTPLLLRHPDSLTGRRIFADLVSLGDLHPTLIEWFDLDSQRGSRSLLSITDSYLEREFPTAPVLSVGGDGGLSLRTQDWRLITPSSEGASPVLFRIEGMQEQELRGDLASEYPEVVRALTGKLETERALMAGAAGAGVEKLVHEDGE